MSTRTGSVALALIVSTLAAAAGAEVVRFQNGAAPAKDYAGCVDTRISVYNDSEAARGRMGDAPALDTFSTARRILVRFDIAALPKNKPVAKALLRVYCAQPTSLTSTMTAAALTRSWDVSATGFEYKETDANKSPEGDWTTKGGDYDDKSAVTAPCRGGPFGHAFEFDVTPFVADWAAGKRENHGLILWSIQHTTHRIASSEWSIAAYRPELLVTDKTDELASWAAPTKEVALSPVAATAGKAPAKPETFAVGMRNDAALRKMSDAYVKTDPKLAGRWGWTPHLRVGGGAGDVNATLMRFDLSVVPKRAAIGSAKLRLYVAGGSRGVRFGVYAAGKDAPDWQAETVSLDEAAAGKPWGKGGYRAAFEDAPAAVATVTSPGKNDPDQRAFIEWDITGATREAAGGKLDLLIAADVEGGAFDAFSSKYDDINARPKLTIEAGPAPILPSGLPRDTIEPPGVPTGDYWVEPMRQLHRKFNGDDHVLGQYGDSITITMAFLATHSYGSIVPGKCPPAVAKRLEIVDKFANKKLWRQWKDPKYGNNGSMTVNWAFRNIHSWQKLCNPAVAVILFGTNDVSYGPVPPDYTEQMTYVIDRMMADGTIPIMTTLPPRGDQKKNQRIMGRVREIRLAQIAIARAKQTPLIDFYNEIVTRQREAWDTKLMGDSLHPSYPKAYQMDFTPEGLANSGYTLRNYLTMMIYADIIEKVLAPAEK